MPELNGKPRRLPTTGNRQPATAFDALRVLARRSLAVGTYGGLCCNTPGCPHPGDKRPAERCPHADECAAELKWLRELAGTDSPQMHADERGGS